MLDLIVFSKELRSAFCDENYRFDICKPIFLSEQEKLEELFKHPGVYIIHGEESEILNICRAQNSIGQNFQRKFGSDDKWKTSEGVQYYPKYVSAIILNDNSAKFAGKIKENLKDWLKPIFKK